MQIQDITEINAKAQGTLIFFYRNKLEILGRGGSCNPISDMRRYKSYVVYRVIDVWWGKNLCDGSLCKCKDGFPHRMVNYLWVEIVLATEVPECFH